MELIKENYSKYYAGSGCSAACVFCYFTILVVTFIPFFLAFTTNNFWIILKEGYEQPVVTFSNTYLVEAYINDSHKFYSNIPLLQNQNTINNLKVSATPVKIDKDDDIVDKMIIDIQINENNADIKSLSSLIFFRVQYSELVDLAFQSFINVNINAVNGLSQAYVVGDISLNQKTPIYAGGLLRDYYDNPPYYDQYNVPLQDSSQIIHHNQFRNETLSFDYQSIVLPQTGENSINVQIEMFIPKYMKIQYVPIITETMKFAWSQYFCFFIIFYIVGRFFMRFFYRTRVLETSVKDDLPTKSKSYSKCKIE